MNQQDRHQGNWYVLTAGLPSIAEPLTLAPGLTLCPVKEPLSVFDLAAAGAVGFRSWAVLEPIAPSCNCEIESARDSALIPGYDTLNRAWLASALLVLRGFTQHLCVAASSYSWNVVAGHQPGSPEAFRRRAQEESNDAAAMKSRRQLPPFKGDLLDFHLTMLAVSDRREGPVTEDDARWMRQHYQVFDQLAAESESFRLSLEAAVDWRFAKDPRSAVARIWSGIEATFGITSELVYRVSLLSASLLEPRGLPRKTRFRPVQKLYGLRSKIVHGEKIDDVKMSMALNDSFQLLRQLLLLTIETGHVLGQDDFDQSVFE
jgi:hypothetical protein